jgi:hypothetical protein
MALNEFKPIIWSDSIFMSYDEEMVFAPLTNRQYDSELQVGTKLKINEIADMTAVNYTQGTDMTFSKVDDAAQFIDITEQKAVPKYIDSIDRYQSNVELMGAVTYKMGQAIARTIDVFLAALASEGTAIDSGTTASPTSITSATITTLFADAGVALDEVNAPEASRVAVVPPWMAKKLTMARATKDTDNSAILTTGYVGEYYGFQVYKSNNISHSGATWYRPMFFLRNDTIAFVEQLTQVEAGSIEKQFGTYVKALSVYGAKVVRPSTLLTEYGVEGAEA